MASRPSPSVLYLNILLYRLEFLPDVFSVKQQLIRPARPVKKGKINMAPDK